MAEVTRKVRILVGKPGLDGHDRGAKVVARALADAGFEVVYTGLHQTPEMIAAAAVQEDVDAVGISVLSVADLPLFPAIIEELRQRGADFFFFFFFFFCAREDMATLEQAGVAMIFPPGTSTEAIVDWVNERVKPRE